MAMVEQAGVGFMTDANSVLLLYIIASHAALMLVLIWLLLRRAG